MKYLFEALPFLFSILVKIFDRYFGNAISDKIVADIPYELAAEKKKDEDEKYTIADVAADGHLRFTYMLALCFSIISAVSVTAKSTSPVIGLLIVVVLVLLITFSFPVLLKKLGWLNMPLDRHTMRRSTVALLILIAVDVALMAFTLGVTYTSERAARPTSVGSPAAPRH